MRKLATFLLVLLFLAVLVPFAPGSVAFSGTWTQILAVDDVYTAAAGNAGGVDLRAASFNNGASIFGWSNSGGPAADSTAYRVFRCSNQATCAASTTFGSSINADGGASLTSIEGTDHGAVCYNDAATALKFQRTTNGGSSWTNAVTVEASATGGDQCAVGGSSSTHWVTAYVGTTPTGLNFSRSTDGGLTWSASTQIEAQAPTNTSVAVKSTTEFLVFYLAGTSLRSCFTSNSGTDWTCTAIDSDVISARAYYSPTADLYYAAALKDTTANFLASEDGLAWSLSPLPTHAINREAIDVARAGEDHYLVTKSALQDAPSMILTATESTDGGLTWTADTEVVAVTTLSHSGVQPTGTAIVTTGEVAFAAIIGHPLSAGAQFTESFRLLSAFTISTQDAEDTIALANDPVGFDVDATGSILMVRENNHASGGTNVSTYSAVTLDQLGGPTSTVCVRNDAIIAEQNHVGYVQCDTGTNPTEFRVRSTSLGTPQFPASCANCAQDISLSGFSAAGGDGLIQLGQIASFPLSHTNIQQTGAANADNAFVAWGFSGWVTDEDAVTGPGRIGVDMFTNKETIIIGDGGGDVRNTAEIAYGAENLGARQMCVSPTSDPLVYRIIAVHEDFASTRFRVNFEFDTGSNTRPELDGAIVNEGSFSGLQGARGVSCSTSGDSKALITAERGTVDEVYLINTTNGNLYWETPKLITGAVSRGAAISGDGLWFAIVDGDFIRAGNALTGNYTVAFNKPAGTIVGMEIDPFGQTLWVATDEGTTGAINKYSLTPFTTVTPCCFLGNPDPGTGTGTGGLAGSGGPLDPAAAGAALGVGSFGGGLFLGVLMMAGMAVGTAGLTYRWNIPILGAMIGLVLGFLLAWAFGWFSTAAVFAIVLLIGAGYGARVWFQRSRGGD